MQATTDLNRLAFSSRVHGAYLGSRIGDALAMPVHWYYDRLALERDYGHVTDFLPPRNPHPDSIFWRSDWAAPSPELDILGDQRPFWGRRGTHYHQNLAAGENTLTAKIAGEAWDSLHENGAYDSGDFLRRYVSLLTHPEKHISGLALMLPVALFHADHEETARTRALEHLALTHPGRKMQVAAEAILSLLLPVVNGGESLDEAIRRESEAQRNPHFGFPFFKWLAEDDDRVVGRRISTACYVEDAVPAVIYLALKYSRRPEEGLIANTNLGGDNVHRGSVLGTLLGAENGADSWPERWANGLRQDC